MARARDVQVDEAATVHLARAILERKITAPPWRTEPHWWCEDATSMLTYVLLLDALNFSFWGIPRWRVTFGDRQFNGYWALAACLRRAVESKLPLLSAEYLARNADAETLFVGDDDVEIPMLVERQNALQEVGVGLLALPGHSLQSLLDESHGRSGECVRLVARHFPSFHDVSAYDGEAVPMYKRAQILVSDLWGAFNGASPCNFIDLDNLTMFADYKVPQVLQGLGVLRYSDTLTETLRRCEEIPAGDPREVEIRAGGVTAVERVSTALADMGRPVPAFQIDWALWTLGQNRTWDLPYHRTRSVYY